jgi:hypothetical protein
MVIHRRTGRRVPMSDHLIVHAFLALYVDEFK